MSGNLGSNSVNKKLLRHAAHYFKEHKTINLKDYSIPLYDSDLEMNSGIPEGALRLGTEIQTSDAIVISSPEYNYSMCGVLKNAIDWVSRIRPNMPITKKPILLMSASPSSFGGIRGLLQTRGLGDVYKRQV